MASPSSDKPHAFNPPTVATPPPTYNQVAITSILPTSKFITLAGQTGITPSTGKTSSDFVEQVRQAYINVYNCLKAVNATPRDIIHVRHYIVQDSGDAELNKLPVVERGWGDVWIEFMDKEGEGHRPPDTVLGVAGLALEHLRYEVEVWAIIHS
jgi:enamine deaminase RidA (YjgF/YER057c/UK114 family)